MIDMRADVNDIAATPIPSPSPTASQPSAAAAKPPAPTPQFQQLYSDVLALGIEDQPLPISAPTMKAFSRTVSQFTKQLMSSHAEMPYQLYNMINQLVTEPTATHLQRATLLEVLYHITLQYKQLTKDQSHTLSTHQTQFHTYLESNLYRLMMLIVPHSIGVELNHTIATRVVKLWQKYDILKKHTLLNMRKMVDTWQPPEANAIDAEDSMQSEGHRSVLHEDDMPGGTEPPTSANKRKRYLSDKSHQTQPTAKRYDYRQTSSSRPSSHHVSAAASLPQRAPPAPLTEHDHEVIRYIEQLRQQQKKRHLEISLRPENESPLDECREVWSNLLSQPLIPHPDFLTWWFHSREWEPAHGCIPTQPPRNSTTESNDSMYTPNYDDLSPVVEPIDDGERNKKLQQDRSTAPTNHRHPPQRPNRAPSYSISDDNIHAR